MKKSELKMKDVVDLARGKKLGYVEDVEIDADEGKIKAIIIPENKNPILNFLSKRHDIIIDWENIEKIGEDVILVHMWYFKK